MSNQAKLLALKTSIFQNIDRAGLGMTLPRTGEHILSRPLWGPRIADYHLSTAKRMWKKQLERYEGFEMGRNPTEDSIAAYKNSRVLNQAYYELPNDLQEIYRLYALENLKQRGKAPPKKGQGKKSKRIQ